jgi:hypothetical protein
MRRVVLVLLVALAFVVITDCGSTGPSQAKTASQEVHVTLDVSTFQGIYPQMPADVRDLFDMELNASMERAYTWTFDDGSKMVVAFKPNGGEGSSRGSWSAGST